MKQRRYGKGLVIVERDPKGGWRYYKITAHRNVRGFRTFASACKAAIAAGYTPA